jgi:hypothetical protein
LSRAQVPTTPQSQRSICETTGLHHDTVRKIVKAGKAAEEQLTGARSLPTTTPPRRRALLVVNLRGGFLFRWRMMMVDRPNE